MRIQTIEAWKKCPKCGKIENQVKAGYNTRGANADLRHYIPTLARRSRCFPRKLENLQAVLDVFVQAYNHFGFQKDRYCSRHPGTAVPFSLVLFFNSVFGHSPFHPFQGDPSDFTQILCFLAQVLAHLGGPGGFLGECDTFAYKHYSTKNRTLWALRPSSAKNAGLLR